MLDIVYYLFSLETQYFSKIMVFVLRVNGTMKFEYKETFVKIV